MNKYRVEIFWYEPGHEFVARIPDIPEFEHISGMGETKEEALMFLENSINDFIKDMKEREYPIPNPHYEEKVS